MAFDFRAFFRFAARLLSKIGDRDFGWTPRRAAVYVTLYLFYPLFELATWLSLLLDALFFRGYRRVEVSDLVFIAGNFRSGTTFLHRLMARDRDRFCTMQMWEVLFAPSILQRRLVRHRLQWNLVAFGPIEQRRPVELRGGAGQGGLKRTDRQQTPVL